MGKKNSSPSQHTIPSHGEHNRMSDRDKLSKSAIQDAIRQGTYEVDIEELSEVIEDHPDFKDQEDH